MTKTIWGVAVVVVAAAALGAVAFVASQGYFTDDATTRTTYDSQAPASQSESTPAPESPETEVARSTDADEETAPDTEETRVADAGEGTAPETEEPGAPAADEETAADTEETRAGGADEEPDAETEQPGSPAGDEETAPDTEETRAGDADEETVPDIEETRVADADEEADAETEQPGSPTGDEETARDGDEEGAGESDQGRGDSEAALEEEAEAYVEQLGEPTDEPIQMEGTAGFASPDQPVASPEADADDSADQGEPRDGDDETEESAARDTAGDAGDTAADAVDLEIAGEARRTEIEAAEAPTVTADAEPAEAEIVAPTDAPEAQDTDEVDRDDEDRSAAEDLGASDAGAPSIDLPVTEQSPVTLADLLGPEETIPSDAVLYVHTVTPQDTQGIWGIVHDGILENFARGVAVHRGESTETYQVDIPENADERRPDNSSSFLGRLIYDKTRRSYVYNYETERIGRNPDLILPGEEIVIVSFTPEELVAVYKHFVRNEEQNES